MRGKVSLVAEQIYAHWTRYLRYGSATRMRGKVSLVAEQIYAHWTRYLRYGSATPMRGKSTWSPNKSILIGRATYVMALPLRCAASLRLAGGETLFIFGSETRTIFRKRCPVSQRLTAHQSGGAIGCNDSLNQ